jgi:MFS family permease
MKGLKNVFRAFKYRNYRLYFIGQSISFTGSWLQQVAIGWLVYRLTNSPLMLGIISFASQAPSFFISPFIGVISERGNRRKMLIFVEWLFLAQAALLTLLVLTGTLQVWNLVGLSILLGFITGIDMTTRHTFFADVVDKKEDLANAIALNSAMFNGSRLIGPAIAGIIIAATGEGICFLINTLCYATILAALYMMNIKKPYKKVKFSEINFIKEIHEGNKYAFHFHSIRDVVIIMCAVFFFTLPFTIFMPVFAKDILKGGPGTMGVLLSAMGAGALVGAIYIAARKNISGLPSILTASAFMECAGVAVFSFSKWMWLSVPAVALAGAGVMIFNSSVNTLLQVLPDENKRGRVISYFIMAYTGIMPFGGLIQGWVAKKIGTPAAVFCGAVLGAICTTWFLFDLKKLRPMIRKVYAGKGMITETEDAAFGGAVVLRGKGEQ